MTKFLIPWSGKLSSSGGKNNSYLFWCLERLAFLYLIFFLSLASCSLSLALAAWLRLASSYFLVYQFFCNGYGPKSTNILHNYRFWTLTLCYILSSNCWISTELTLRSILISWLISNLPGQIEYGSYRDLSKTSMTWSVVISICSRSILSFSFKLFYRFMFTYY